MAETEKKASKKSWFKGLVQFVELRIGAYLQFLDAP